MKKYLLILGLLLLGFIKLHSADAQASCPVVPSGSPTDTMSVTTTAGTYNVWSRIKAADSTNNSFYLKIDSDCAILIGDSSQISSSTWTWVDYQNGNSSNKISQTLTAGNHVITLFGNEPGVGVDKILFTKNLTCTPINLGDNCPAELPTQAPTSVPTAQPTNSPATPTLTPFPSVSQGSTVLHFPRVLLHGIGSGGDNTNATILGNQNPKTTSKVISVEIYGTSGQIVSQANGNVQFSGGAFTGDIILDSQLASGNYLIKVKTDKYLKKQLPGIIVVTKSQTNQMPTVALTSGDINNDAVLSIADYNILMGCYSDLLPAKDCDSARKQSSDLSDDGKVDQDDYNLLLRELSVVSGD